MNTAKHSQPVINGINPEQVMALATKISQDDGYGKFKFRANTQWIDGSRSRTNIQGFHAGGNEDAGRINVLTVDADQPEFLGGSDTSPNPVEHLLHSLNSCLSTTLVYHASVQGIALESVDVSSEGQMNAKGFFGISDTVNKGYERINVIMKVKSDADVDVLNKLAMYSPVYEMVSSAVAVDFTMEEI